MVEQRGTGFSRPRLDCAQSWNLSMDAPLERTSLIDVARDRYTPRQTRRFVRHLRLELASKATADDPDGHVSHNFGQPAVRPSQGFSAASMVVTTSRTAEERVQAPAVDIHGRIEAGFTEDEVYEVLKQATSVAGELMALSGPRNPYPGKLGVIEEGAYADILIVDGNPLEDFSTVGTGTKWFGADPRPESPETIRVIMKDGAFFKNTLD